MRIYKRNRVVRAGAVYVGAAALTVGMFACGGSSGGGKKAGKPVAGTSAEPIDPGSLVGKPGGKQGSKPTPVVVDPGAARKFEAAAAFYKLQAKAGWTRDTCSAAASKFASVASRYPKLVAARFNVGVAYQNCGMLKKAEAEYLKALKVSAHGGSLSNLGEIYFKGGKVGAARKYWEKAIQTDSKLAAARNNLSWLMLKELRRTKNRSAWKALEQKIKDQLSSVLAVQNENVQARVLYGLLYMEGSERNKDRLLLAKLLFDEAAKRAKDYPALHNARGLLYMRHKDLGRALIQFLKAVKSDPKFMEARMNVGLITLGFRKYDSAYEQFSAVLRAQPKNYDALMGLGIASRGLASAQLSDGAVQKMRQELDGGRSPEDVARSMRIPVDTVNFWSKGALPSVRKPKLLGDAEANYKKAMRVDNQRPGAYFNLGVLYKDFRANAVGDLKASQNAYRTAQKYFEDFLNKKGVRKSDRKEALDSIKDCKKIIRQLGEVMKANAAAKAAAGKK